MTNKVDGMNQDISVKVLDEWWSLFRANRDQQVRSMGIAFFASITAFNPNIYLNYHYIIHNGDNSFLLIMWIVFVVGIGLLLSCFIISIFYTIFSEIYCNIKSNKFSEQNFKVNIIHYKVRSSKSLLKYSPSFHLRQKDGEYYLYNIAGTEKLLLGSIVFGAGFVGSCVGFVLAGMVINGSIFILGSGFDLKMLLISSGSTLIILVLNALFSSWFDYIKQVKTIRNAVNIEKPGSTSRYCEFDIDGTRFDDEIVKTEFKEHQPRCNLMIAEHKMEELKVEVYKSDYSIQRTFNAAIALIQHTYSTMGKVNTINNIGFSLVDSEKHVENIRYLQLVVNSYIPKLIEEIIKGKINFEKDLGISSDKSEIAAAYNELYDDITSKNIEVLEIESYYSKVSTNGILGGIKGFIKSQSKENQLANNPIFSSQTAVIDKSLNQEIIPKLEYLLIHADDCRKIKIQTEIANIKAFFEKQVEIDRRNMCNMRLSYDKTVTIDSDNNLPPTLNSIDEYLENVYYYRKELEKNW